MKDKLKPAVGYIRMSTDQQQDSPARQRRDIEALAKRLGYHIIDWYEDHGLTGTPPDPNRFSAVLWSHRSQNFVF